MNEPRYRLLGVEVNALTVYQLNQLVGTAVESRSKWIIANHNLHSLYIYHHDAEMRAFFEAARFAHIDGMPIVWLGRAFGYPFTREHRVTYVDWIEKLAEKAVQSDWRLFYLGSKPGIAEHGTEILRKRYPGLQIASHHGYFNAAADSPENESVLQSIRDFRTDVLFVGMGMPRQERWIKENYAKLHVNVILPSGACIDYVAGAIPTPPRWLGRVGLEWAYRLWCEPRRLMGRYLVEPWFILRLIWRDRRNLFRSKIPPASS